MNEDRFRHESVTTTSRLCLSFFFSLGNIYVVSHSIQPKVATNNCTIKLNSCDEIVRVRLSALFGASRFGLSVLHWKDRKESGVARRASKAGLVKKSICFSFFSDGWCEWFDHNSPLTPLLYSTVYFLYD